MGFSYSMLASALWPMVALVVPEYQLGTAYGMWVNLSLFSGFNSIDKLIQIFSRMQAVQNLGMAIVTMLAGRIVDDQGYLVLEVFFLGWLCCN